MVVFHDPGSVPGNWKSEENIEEGNLISNNIQRTATVRYCNHCQNGKPPRCHHCSICKLPQLVILSICLRSSS